ncbi:beta-1,3-glucanase family protein [Xanthobacter agilis]|uniref:GH64 domain-containing protein n=1 Tax=Xanthobacter agilis TaxID=47492 RepID=A0ABU0LDY9_XANAG|nr:beta-1,3-glucanase family protein [Xanthobacter agilis]MDQ0505362.1 hypothetical protein [Xanthobacter agilis]
MRAHWIRTVTSAIALMTGLAGAQAASAEQLLPVTITNQTGYKGPIYVTVYGSENPAKPNTWYYVAKTGAATKFNDTVKQPTNFGFSFTGSSTALRVPMLQSARIYFSFCAPLKLTVANGTPSTPDATTPGSQTFNIPFDFVEYTWVPIATPKNNTQIWVNTTQVDAFGLPIRMTLAGKPYGKATQLTGGFNSPTAGPNIIAAIKKAGAPWTKLMVSNGKWPIRLISPVHTMTLATSSPYYFPSNYWDKYITSVFNYYAKASNSFSVNTGTTTYKGTVTNGQMVLTPTGGGAATVFGKPTSQYLWANGAPPISGGNVATLQKFIQASFLRSTFLTNNNLSKCSGMTPYTSSPINQYSKVIHQFAYNQEAYTFGYDDVCSQSSTTSLIQPTSINLTLYPLAGNMARMTCP